MTTLHFKARLDQNGVIQVPDEIAAQLDYNSVIDVAITLTGELDLSTMSKDEIWQSVLDFIDQHVAQGYIDEPYKFNREELYSHLDKYGKDSAD